MDKNGNRGLLFCGWNERYAPMDADIGNMELLEG